MCIRDSITSLFPASAGRNFIGGGTVGYHVQQAILKIEAMQLYNGGFSLWPQGGNADWWASAYATHFLIEAEEAGYEVNKKALDGALRYLAQKAVSYTHLDVYKRQVWNFQFQKNICRISMLMPPPSVNQAICRFL